MTTSSTTHLDPVRPIHWFHEVRKWLDESETFESRVTPSYVAFLLAIWSWANKNDGSGIRVSIERVAHITKSHPQTTKKNFQRAVSDGWLQKTSGSNNRGPNQYALSIRGQGESQATYGYPNSSLVGTTTAPYEHSRPVLVETSSDLVGTIHGPGRESQTPPIRGSVEQGVGGTVTLINDRTHGNRHPPGNPQDINCRTCGDERLKRNNAPPNPPTVHERLAATYCDECGEPTGRHIATCKEAS